MKVSVNSIKFMNQRYGCAGDPAPDGVEKLAEKIGAQLGAIEEIIDIGSKYEDILVVKVVSCVQHPNADRLHVCKVDDGGKAQNVERDENGHVQVVCGAPNVHEGMLAAWLPPGSTVPSTVDKDPFVLEAREIRGEKSNGMMASPKELGIGDSHEGILEIDKDVAPGSSFAETYELAGDKVLDIENKMFTHRPDCFGMMGVAREIAGIQNQPFKSPDWYRLDADLPEEFYDDENDSKLLLITHNEIPELVPRFTAITMRDVKVGPSPVRLQVELAKVGLRPINNIVDYTNYFMLLTGQPLHAYDYDKLRALDYERNPIMEKLEPETETKARNRLPELVVRHPKPGEKIKLLNGKEIEPRPEAIMIASRTKLIGIGGVMGGSETEVDENTKNIIIECATFDMYSIRRTSMAHGLFTDAVTRFNKGQSPLQNRPVILKIAGEISQFAGGKIAGVVDRDEQVKEMLERGSVHPPVNVTPEFVNVRLGLKLSADEIVQLLKNVEFDVQQNGEGLVVKAPFWRTDIEVPEDVVEEVGRLYGYDKLPLELPKRDITPAPKDQMLELKSKIRDTLSKAGANEVLTYSFVHGNLLDKVGQDKNQAFQIANALSPDLQYYRLSLVPGLLDKIHQNIKAGHDEFALFEIGKAHVLNEPDPVEPDIPKEVNALGFVFAADGKVARQKYSGAAYYEAVRYLMNVLEKFQISGAVDIEPLIGADLYNNPWVEQMVAPFERGRSAVLRDKVGVLPGTKGLILGIVGEFESSVRKALKLPEFAAGFELDPLLFSHAQQTSYVALPRFPKIAQDITLKVPAGMNYAELYEFVDKKIGAKAIDETHIQLDPLDVFQRSDDSVHKQVTFRFTTASYQRTLTDAEVAKILDEVAAAAKEKFGVERI